MASQIEKGIKSIQKEFNKVVNRLEKFIKEISKLGMSKPAEKTRGKQAKAVKKTTTTKKKPAARKKAASTASVKSGTAFASVMAIIAKSENGVNTTTLMEKTGFDFKKISNIIFKAKTKGLIKTVKKGVYVTT
ncbi:MAG: hypothetical protein ACOZF0_22505 [Thermodesulfobacteriota bacterium]